MTVVERLVTAARDFHEHEMSIRASRRALRHCEEYSKGDYATGDPGSPSCDLDPDQTDCRCGACEARVAGAPAYRLALRKRNLAKQRILRCAARLPLDTGTADDALDPAVVEGARLYVERSSGVSAAEFIEKAIADAGKVEE